MTDTRGTSEPRPRVRLITAAWGVRHVDTLLTLTLPAILAPGNLQHLAGKFECEFVLLTEEHFFGYIQRHAIFEELTRHCNVSFRHLDDLVVSKGMYGISLTYAFHRGFADLGEAVTNTNLIFFNADFIMADGNLAAVARHIEKGERLLLAPSYCVVAEAVAPLLLSRRREGSTALSVPAREMAAIALRHRHNTIRAKTVNRQHFHMTVSDQFYWHVDDDTLLGYQMPIALVCVRPERLYREPDCFWDYATLSEMAPSLRRHVLGDSDEFLMIELRGRDVYQEYMIPGAVSCNAVAARLGQYMTADQLELGRYPLTLHASDLPTGTGAQRTMLDDYMRQIYAELPQAPVGYRNHPYWTPNLKKFHAKRQLWESRKQAAAGAQTDRTVSARAGLLRRLFDAAFGSLPNAGPLHPYRLCLADAHRVLDRFFSGRATSSLSVTTEDGYLYRRVERESVKAIRSSLGHAVAGALPQHCNFDLCLVEVPWTERGELSRLLAAIWRHLNPDGLVLIHFDRLPAKIEAGRLAAELARFLPQEVVARVYCAGGSALAGHVYRYRAALERLSTLPAVWRSAGLLLSLLISSLPVALMNFRQRNANASEIAGPYVSLTIEVRENENPGFSVASARST